MWDPLIEAISYLESKGVSLLKRNIAHCGLPNLQIQPFVDFTTHFVDFKSIPLYSFPHLPEVPHPLPIVQVYVFTYIVQVYQLSPKAKYTITLINLTIVGEVRWRSSFRSTPL